LMPPFLVSLCLCVFVLLTCAVIRNASEFDMTPVTSPMVGKVLSIPVKVGDQVREDDTIIVMEAMKMEIPILAPVTGIIKEIKVAAGDTIESEAVVALIE